MNTEDLIKLVEDRKWVSLAAVVIFWLTRLLKSDTKIPIDIPARYRWWLALGLGILSGVLEKVASSGTQDAKTWTSAIVGGLISFALASLGHQAIIENLRDGKELPIPGLMIPGARPSPDKPITIPPETPKTEGPGTKE